MRRPPEPPGGWNRPVLPSPVDTNRPPTSRELTPEEQNELLHELIGKCTRLEQENRELKASMVGVMVDNIRLRKQLG